MGSISKSHFEISLRTSPTQSSLYHPVIEELKTWLNSSASRRDAFRSAIRTATSYDIELLSDITDLESYFIWTDSLLNWVPSEDFQATLMVNQLAKLHFILDQPSLSYLHTPEIPSPHHPHTLTWLSEWQVRFSAAFGAFMNTPESLTPSTLSTFAASPAFRIDDYTVPPGGWRTFNEFFARQFKPGRRPIASAGSKSVITSPADFTFKALEPVAADGSVTMKGLTWSIAELLRDSQYAGRFAGGTWMHGFLNVSDYHRIHAPVAGTVLEARTIMGTNNMHVEIGEAKSGGAELVKRRVLNVVDDEGYQFMQERGLFVLDTGETGLVCVLPVGMSVVSSVVLTAEVGARVVKGGELGYFQFGGSDCVLVFENAVDISQVSKHYLMGQQIGRFI